MTPERLAEIREIVKVAREVGVWKWRNADLYYDLFDESERLRAEVERLRAALREVAAMTADPDVFRAVVEATCDPPADCKQSHELMAMGGRFYTMGEEAWCDTATETWRLVPGRGYVRAPAEG